MTKEVDYFNLGWDTPIKQAYRERCIINPYRELFNRESLPDDLWYWSICGNMQPSDGQDSGGRDGVEIGQLVKSGLIRPSQFMGVDRDKEIINRNRMLWPEAHWITGNFSDVLHRDTKRKPAIIHADTTNLLGNVVGMVGDIIAYVEELDIEVMVVVNSLSQRWIDTLQDRQPNHDAFIDAIHKFIMSLHWEVDSIVDLSPGGKERAKCEMITYTFYHRRLRGL